MYSSSFCLLSSGKDYYESLQSTLVKGPLFLNVSEEDRIGPLHTGQRRGFTGGVVCEDEDSYVGGERSVTSVEKGPNYSDLSVQSTVSKRGSLTHWRLFGTRKTPKSKE